MTKKHDTVAVLWGTLERKGPDRWEWCNGDPAPEVRDMTAQAAYSFRVRNYADRSLVEVPLSALRENPDLTWIREHYQRKGLDGDRVEHAHAKEQSDIQYKEAPSVYLVPLEVWDRWANNTVVGAEWDLDDQERIIDRARTLRESPEDTSD